jgi:Protein of unknown function (DUF4240)
MPKPDELDSVLRPEDAWSFLETARVRAMHAGDIAPELTKLLTDCAPATIVAFQQFFEVQMGRANLADLHAAAHLINGGSSELGFEHFRAWLIAQGQEVFEAARVDADRLATVAVKPKQARMEELLFAAATAYNLRTGATDFYERFSRSETPFEGIAFKSERELATRLPLLYAKYRP